MGCVDKPFDSAIIKGWILRPDEEARTTSTTLREAPTKLSRWRTETGMTLQEVADLTGASMAMLNRLERGERQAVPAMKVRIARGLRVRVADLFEVEEFDEDAGQG